MSNHSFIKYLTEQFVIYINQSPDEKDKQKTLNKSDSLYTSHWFGLIPFAFRMVFKK